MCALQLIQIDEWFAGILLASFIGLITWIFIRSINSQDELSRSVSSLQVTLEGLRTLVNGIVKEREASAGNCMERHEGLNDWMNEHEESIKDHSNRITRVETHLKIN